MRRGILLVAFALVGCPTPLPKHVAMYPITGAPPSRKLEFVSKDDTHTITVSSGVAFGVSVSDPCEGMSSAKLEIADTNVLQEHPLGRSNYRREFVLVAVRPGKTTVKIKAACAAGLYEVTVLPQ